MIIKIAKFLFLHSPMIASIAILITFLLSLIREGYFKVNKLLAFGLGVLAYLLIPLVVNLTPVSGFATIDKISQGIAHVVWIFISLIAIGFTLEEDKKGFYFLGGMFLFFLLMNFVSKLGNGLY